ncbi:LPXTG cell wall anchor domain-containing protein [Staphylococcus pasteuri]|uniref:LPXTG cell wall anchor domain-containing protein n=1 Tax=Staphylococcus pasteuri TaxID=45972 RepID=UPI0023DDF5C2|nr:LPXTG cell wall anchor domain-containing protein [Staphylococcus pasteuri]
MEYEGDSDADGDADYESDSDADSDNDKDHSDDKALPETGEESNSNNATLFGTLFAGLGSLFLFGRRRKKDAENK